MPGTILLIDRSRVVPGRLKDLKAAFVELARFVEAEEPRAIAYDVYFSEGDTVVTVVQVHPDSASVERHMEVAAHLFPRFKDLVQMRSMEVYGEPSPALLEQLRRKARMLGAGDVQVHAHHAGFSRQGRS